MSKKKIGGQVQVTFQMLENLLALPVGCRLVSVGQKLERDVATFKFHADKAEKGIAYEIAEGANYPNITIRSEDLVKRALALAEDIHEQAKDESRNGNWARKVLAEYEKEKEVGK